MNLKKSLPSIPLIVWMSLFVALPLIYILGLSFLTRGPSGNVIVKFTLENYQRLMEPMYLKIFGRSALIALLTSILTLIVGYPFAYFLSNLEGRRKSLTLLVLMIPFWTNSLIRVYGIIILLRRDGVINQLFLKLGIFKESVILLYNYPTILGGMVYMLLPFMILPLFNSIEKLDRSYLEAAKDLGASKYRTFLDITLPLTLPGIVSGGVLVFILAIAMFFVSDLLGGGRTMLVGNLIQLQMTSARDWPFGAAISVILILGILIFVWIYLKSVKIASDREKEGF